MYGHMTVKRTIQYSITVIFQPVRTKQKRTLTSEIDYTKSLIGKRRNFYLATLHTTSEFLSIT